jgi:23S rRNA pseudouridine1911/1915/1917 synthase
MDRFRQDLYKVELIVAPGEGNRLLHSYLTGKKHLSAKALGKLKNQGSILVNDVPAPLKSTIREGDRIVLVYPPEKKNPYLAPEELPIKIVYEDQDILVLDKQAGVCVHPTKHYPRGTLANGVLYHWEKNGDNSTPHIVNRLDRNTSGLVLLAKSTYVAQQFFNQQRDKTIKRSYLALVLGEVQGDSGYINLPIAREDKPTARRMISKDGKPATTYYQVEERLLGYTLLAARLETGRTHQIRVHLSYLGYPILGDFLYGGETAYLKRQFLHAFQLNFKHPVNQEEMTFTSMLPDELEIVLTKIKN